MPKCYECAFEVEASRLDDLIAHTREKHPDTARKLLPIFFALEDLFGITDSNKKKAKAERKSTS